MLLRCCNQTVLGRRSRSGGLPQLHAHRVVIVTGHQIQRVTVLQAVGGVPFRQLGLKRLARRAEPRRVGRLERHRPFPIRGGELEMLA